jgi:hypothetical protein
MSRCGLVMVLVLGTCMPVSARAIQPTAACLEAAATAQRKWALPPGLVASIGRVESGRYDLATRTILPWPWTVNAAGSSRYFATRAEAVAFVRTLQARGVQIIDVGCFQIDLFFHPEAFASVNDAFDPGMNADYAARFLTALYSRTGSWSGSVSRYHSGLLLEGESYRQRVLAVWQSVAPQINLTLKPSTTPEIANRPAPDRYVIRMSEEARAIQVFRPSTADKN